MRVIIYFLISFLLGIVQIYAQTETHTESTNKTSVRINGELVYDGGDISISGHENSYFSTSDSDDTYKVRAKFNDRKTAKVRAYLVEELGTTNMTKNGDKQQWKVSYTGDTSYEVKLDEGSLRIFIDKEVASSQLLNKFKVITKNIKNYTSGKSREKLEAEEEKRKEEQLEREAEQLMREAERKIREAERLQREAERMKREAQRKTGY